MLIIWSVHLIGGLQPEWGHCFLCRWLLATVVHEISGERRVCQLQIPERFPSAIWTYHEEKQVKPVEPSRSFQQQRHCSWDWQVEMICCVVGRQLSVIWWCAVWLRWSIHRQRTSSPAGRTSSVCFILQPPIMTKELLSLHSRQPAKLSVSIKNFHARGTVLCTF